jgi:hypothetical protein
MKKTNLNMGKEIFDPQTKVSVQGLERRETNSPQKV